MNKALFKLFSTAFNEKNVLDNFEFYGKVHFLSKDVSNEMIKDMEQLGLVKVDWHHGKAIRIYQKNKLV